MNSAVRPSFKKNLLKSVLADPVKKRAKCASQTHTYYNFLEKLYE